MHTKTQFFAYILLNIDFKENSVETEIIKNWIFHQKYSQSFSIFCGDGVIRLWKFQNKN